MIANIILIGIILVLFFFIFMLKKEIKNITMQLDNIAIDKTEKNIDVSLFDKDITTLAETINKNISSQKNLRIEVFKKDKKLKQSISNVSHDLRTPLTSIIGYLQLLDKEELSTKQKDYVTTILQKSDNLKSLINYFFELSFFESNEQKPNFKKINLANFTTDFILENALSFEKANIEPTINITASDTSIWADELMLNRILQNLLSNAINYGVGNIFITISQDNGVKFEIENEVKDENIDTTQLFDRFYLGTVRK